MARLGFGIGGQMSTRVGGAAGRRPLDSDAAIRWDAEKTNQAQIRFNEEAAEIQKFTQLLKNKIDLLSASPSSADQQMAQYYSKILEDMLNSKYPGYAARVHLRRYKSGAFPGLTPPRPPPAWS